MNFEWIDVRESLPTEPYDDEYMVCIKGAMASTVCSFENGRFIDKATGLHPQVEYWHKCPQPPKLNGMIVVGEAKAFRGVMRVTGEGCVDEVISGDFIYSPATRKWYHGESGQSYHLFRCVIEEVYGWERR